MLPVSLDELSIFDCSFGILSKTFLRHTLVNKIFFKESTLRLSITEINRHATTQAAAIID
jgi:hypothetical protein